jgi:ribosomal protein S18 acetylase RimI-like enzyme
MLLVDVGIDSVVDAAARREVGEGPRLRSGLGGDLSWAAPFAGRAFVYSRFASDPFFTRAQVDAFHRQWVTNLWNGLARHVIVAENRDGSPAGFVCCGLDGDEGRIVLIASESQVRRAGVGKALVRGALDWFARNGAQTVRVKTQAANIPALALYQREGFVTCSTELTYSWSRERSQGASAPHNGRIE